MGGFSPASLPLVESATAILQQITIPAPVNLFEDNLNTAAGVNSILVPTGLANAGNTICITVMTSGTLIPTITSIAFGSTTPVLIASNNDGSVAGTDSWWAYWIQSVPASQQSLTVSLSGTPDKIAARVQIVSTPNGVSATALFNSAISNSTLFTYSSGTVTPPAGSNVFYFGGIADATTNRMNPPVSPWVTNDSTFGWIGYAISSGNRAFASTFTALSFAVMGIAAIVATGTILGGAGGKASITPGQVAQGASGGVGASRYSGLTWDVTGIAVSVSTNINEAKASCYVSYGILSQSPADFQGQTDQGSTGDTNSVALTLRPGDWITVIWTGGDVGSIATMRILGQVNPPGVH
jgi:hypothetical protein